MRFIVTTHPGLEGARLSRLGHWGNDPHPSVDAAEARARQLAGAGPCAIEHERGKALRTVPIGR